jgi:hypothetical protein
VTSLTELLAEATSRPVKGWDFSWLGERVSTRPLDWSFDSIVEERSQHAPNLLDMSTGGGEWLAALRHRPARTVATEGWPPNVIVAARRLRPLGVPVVWSEDAPDNVDQRPGEPCGRLPFRAGSFALVVNRHASFAAAEVTRVLSTAGAFLTQQMGSDYGDAYDALGLDHPKHGREWNVALASEQLAEAGLRIAEAREGNSTTEFADVGAFAWYLRAVPWVIPGFTTEAHRPALERLHEKLTRGGPLTMQQSAFFLAATK